MPREEASTSQWTVFARLALTSSTALSLSDSQPCYAVGPLWSRLRADTGPGSTLIISTRCWDRADQRIVIEFFVSKSFADFMLHRAAVELP